MFRGNKVTNQEFCVNVMLNSSITIYLIMKVLFQLLMDQFRNLYLLLHCLDVKPLSLTHPLTHSLTHSLFKMQYVAQAMKRRGKKLHRYTNLFTVFKELFLLIKSLI